MKYEVHYMELINMTEYKDNTIYFFELLITEHFNFATACNNLFKSNETIFYDKVKKHRNLSIPVEIEETTKWFTDEYKEYNHLIYAIKMLDYKLYEVFGNDYSAALNQVESNLKDKKRDYKKAFKRGFYSNLRDYDLKFKGCEEWLNNKNMFILSDFAFFESMYPAIQVSHFLLVLDYYLIKYHKLETKDTYIYPSTDSSLSIYGINSNNIYVKPSYYIDDKNNAIVFFKDFDNKRGKKSRIILHSEVFDSKSIEFDDEGNIISLNDSLEKIITNRYPNNFDNLIQLFAYNLITLEVCETSKCRVEFKELIDFIIKNQYPQFEHLDNTKNNRYFKFIYELKKNIINSINKCSYLRLTEYEVDENGKSIFSDQAASFSIITEMNPDENNSDYIILSYSYNSLKLWRENLHTIVLAKEYDKLSNHVSKQIMFYLQEQRVESRLSDYHSKIYFDSFCQIFAPLVSKKQYLKVLKEAMDCLIKENVILKNYNYNNNIFSCDFLSLSDYEKELYKTK